MRKTTVNLIVGILIGISIVKVSEYGIETSQSVQTTPTLATTSPVQSNVSDPFDQQIAPGLQIVEVPPPLDMNGRVPYQCYFNGQHIRLPNEVVKQIVAKHGNPTDNDPNFNVHNFTGNLKMINLPVGSTVPTSPFPVAGRIR
jgi:hypothetical protein